MKLTHIITILLVIIYGLAGAIALYNNLAYEKDSKLLQDYQVCLSETEQDVEYCYSVYK